MDSQSKIRQATLEDYLFWLDGYLQKGGQPTDYFRCPFENHIGFAFYEAGANQLLIEGLGAHPSFIIIPSGASAPIVRGGIVIMLYVGSHEVQAINIRPPVVPIFNNREFLEHPLLGNFWAQHPVG